MWAFGLCDRNFWKIRLIQVPGLADDVRIVMNQIQVQT